MIANVDWSVGQAAKTSPSHGENRGSIPLRTVLPQGSPYDGRDGGSLCSMIDSYAKSEL